MNTKRMTMAVLGLICSFVVYSKSMHVVSMQKPRFPRFDFKNLKIFGLDYEPQSADGFRKDLVIGYREYYVINWSRTSFHNNCGIYDLRIKKKMPMPISQLMLNQDLLPTYNKFVTCIKFILNNIESSWVWYVFNTSSNPKKKFPKRTKKCITMWKGDFFAHMHTYITCDWVRPLMSSAKSQSGQVSVQPISIVRFPIFYSFRVSSTYVIYFGH